MSFSISTQKNSYMPQIESYPEINEGLNNHQKIDLESRVRPGCSEPESKRNERKINNIYSEKTFNKNSLQEEWSLNREEKNQKIGKYVNPDKIKKINFQLDPRDHSTQSPKPLTFGQVQVMKSSEMMEQSYVEDKQYSNADKVNYNALMKIFVQDRDLKGCGALLEEMQKAGIRPDESVSDAMLILYKDEIQYSIKNETLTTATDLLEEIWEAEIMPDIEAYNIIMQIYVDYGDRERVDALMKNMWDDHVKPDITTYNLLIEFAAKNRDLKRMWSVFEEMKKAGFQPDERTKSIFKTIYV